MSRPNSVSAPHRKRPSAPGMYLHKHNLLVGDCLDYGCGQGFDKRYFGMDGYDPTYYPQFPAKKYDTIVCNYVLNVVTPEEQNDIITSINSLLKKNGRAYFTVRRDITEDIIIKNRDYTQRAVFLDFKSATLKKGKYEIYIMEKKMKPEYKHISLIFENCNVVEIMPEHIQGFYIQDISHSIWCNGTQYSESKQCKFFQLQLDNAALANKTHFENEFNSSNSSFLYHLEKLHDITHINITLQDDSTEYIHVPWSTEKQYYNMLEKIEWLDDRFIITIEEERE